MKNIDNLLSSMIEKKDNKFRSHFGLGDMVYLKTDSDGQIRIVTSIKFNINNSVIYTLSCGVSDSNHYECEMIYDKPFLNL